MEYYLFFFFRTINKLYILKYILWIFIRSLIKDHKNFRYDDNL